MLAQFETIAISSFSLAIASTIALGGHCTYNCKSSAKSKYDTLQCRSVLGSELISATNKEGPGDEPCGTPELTALNEETKRVFAQL